MQLKIGQRVRVIGDYGHLFDLNTEGIVLRKQENYAFVINEKLQMAWIFYTDLEHIPAIDWADIEQEWMKGVMHNSEEKGMKDIFEWFKEQVEKQLNK